MFLGLCGGIGFGLQMDTNLDTNNAFVSRNADVKPAAKKAGVRQGDTIMRIGGEDARGLGVVGVQHLIKSDAIKRQHEVEFLFEREKRTKKRKCTKKRGHRGSGDKHEGKESGWCAAEIVSFFDALCEHERSFTTTNFTRTKKTSSNETKGWKGAKTYKLLVNSLEAEGFTRTDM